MSDNAELPRDSIRPPTAEVSVTLKLPPDLVAAIRQRAAEVGRSPTQVIVEALWQGLGQHSPSFQVTQEDWQHLMARLSTLELLTPKVAELEQTLGYLLAQPSAPTGAPLEAPAIEDQARSTPSATPPTPQLAKVLDQCPKCQHRLGPPLRFSGRQVCSKCGWSDRPQRSPSTESTPARSPTTGAVPRSVPGAIAAPLSQELPPEDLKRLLAKAAEQALNNMDPKKRK